jgi:hypothetical protein
MGLWIAWSKRLESLVKLMSKSPIPVNMDEQQSIFIHPLGLDFMSFIQNCFFSRPSDYTVSEDAGLETRTIRQWHWQSDALTTRLDIIPTKVIF